MTAHAPEPLSAPGGGERNSGSADPPSDEPVPLDLAPRPFLMTQGRTQGSSEAIAIETQVVATERGLADQTHDLRAPGHRRIMP